MKLLSWFKKSDQAVENSILKNEVEKLKAVALLKDELYLTKYLEFENFKKSTYTTLAAIALAHGGEYYIDNQFTNTILSEEFTGKISITSENEGMKIALGQVDEVPVGE